MSVRSLSLAKEARLLLAAWILVMAAGVLSLVPVPSVISAWNIHALLEALVPFGAMFGIPLLATLAFGSEFQYRTMPLLLAQPVDRRRIWREKMVVSLATVATAAVVYALALHALHAGRTEEWESVIAVAVVTLAAAPFYIFVARSMIGGLVLNISGFFVITLLLDYFAYLVQTSVHGGYQAYDDRHLRHLPAWFLVAGALVYASYAVVMAWLGRRSLLKLQAIEGMQSGEAILPGAQLFPRFLSDWFRCRARGRMLNLVRREFHLLRIVWTLGVVCAVMWLAIAGFGLMPTPYSYRFILLVGIAVIGNVVIAVLAGTISLGEEKTWGTHGWHLTLPVSANVQWAVKLLIALFTSAVCAVLVPVAILRIGGMLGGMAHGLVGDSDLGTLLLYALLMTLAAFWSSCMVQGTVRGTVWVIPVGLTVLGSVLFTSWAAEAGWFEGAIARMVAAAGPIRMMSITDLLWRLEFHKVLLAAMIAIVAGVALIQTHRAFAARREEMSWTPARALVPVALATVLCAIAIEAAPTVAIQAYRQQSRMLLEIHHAIVDVQAKPPLPPNIAQQIPGDELARQAGVSPQTRKWLMNARVTVLNDTPALNEVSRHSMIAPNMFWAVDHDDRKPSAEYLAIVRLANGTDCAFKYYNAPRDQRYYHYSGRISGSCE